MMVATVDRMAAGEEAAEQCGQSYPLALSWTYRL
jgi:hypothetical protein